MDPELELDTPRADLEAAFEQHAPETEAGGSPSDPPEPVRTPPEEAPAGGEPDKAAPEGGKPDAAGAAPAVGKQPPVVDPAKPTDPNAAAEVKAPVAWKAGAKAEWAKVPKAAQEEITRRETEVQKALSQSVNARNHWNEFNQTVAPFMPLIRAQNSTPMQAFKNLMTTAAGLTVGSPEQKARIVAEMIGNFQVDIKALDGILANNPTPAGRGNGTSDIEVAIQRQLSPVFDFMNNVKQTAAQRQQQTEAQTETEVAAFAEKNEFFEQLREEVADYLEVSARRGREMTLQQAYDRACQDAPDVKKVLQQRAAQQQANLRNGTVARARQAASSVIGKPNMGGGADPQRDTRRDDLLAAWEAASDR